MLDRLPAGAVDDERHHLTRQEDEQPERAERGQGVEEVGAPQLEAAPERVDDAEPLGHGRGHGQPEQREPGDARQDEAQEKDRRRQVDEDAHRHCGQRSSVATGARRPPSRRQRRRRP